MKKLPRRKDQWGWILYDTANSAFATTCLAAVLPIYYLSLVPEGGIELDIGGWRPLLMGDSLWAGTVAMSAALVAVLAPALGALADSGRGKVFFLAIFCFMGSIATLGFVGVGQGQYWLASAIFIVANLGFSGGNVFYNGLLRDLATDEEIDNLSGLGYAAGYVGGGLVLILNLAMIMKPHAFGIPSSEWGYRLCFVTVGIWWAAWSLPLFRWVRVDANNSGHKDKGLIQPLPIAIIKAVSQVWHTMRNIGKFRDLALMLVAYLIYNDGITTVIVMATAYGKTALGLETFDLIGAILLIQILGGPGSIICGRSAARFGAKPTLLVTLSLWIVAVLYATIMTTATQFWGLAVLVALILGGSQAISRSLFASMVPRSRSTEFFGFFSISGRFSSVFGPATFTLVSILFGSPRAAILSLVVFFLVGGLILLAVDVKRGRAIAAGQ